MRVLTTLLTTMCAAENRMSRELHGVSFAAARSGLLGGGMHAANNYGRMTTTRGRSAAEFVNEFKHPRGGPTVERCAIVRDGRGKFELRVDAASPQCPLGDNFETRVDVELEQPRGGGPCVLRARSRVRWLSRGRPAGFISSRVERAAERGATDAYAAFADALVDRGAAATLPEKLARRKRPVFGALLLGGVVAFLQANGRGVPEEELDSFSNTHL